MGVYVGLVAGLLGVVAIIAGVQGHGPAFFSAITGLGVPAAGSTSGTAPAVSKGPGSVAAQAQVSYA
jgi:hypothetical protein